VVVCGSELLCAVGSGCLRWEWLSAKGSGSLLEGVIVCEWEWLFVAGSGCLRYGVVVCGRELLSADGVVVYERE
jgi:hypothetical protein